MAGARVRRTLLTLALVTVLPASAACDRDGPDAPTKGLLQVAATVAPVVDMVRAVAGERAVVVPLVPPGRDSHTYEARPSDVRALGSADLLIANGLRLEEPLLALAAANLPEGSPIVRLADQTITAEDYVYDRSYPEEGGKPNPHLWLDVGHAVDYVEHIAEALTAVDPEGRGAYAANASAYRTLLQRLDAAVAAAVATIPAEHRRLVTYHDSWAYFGPRYGLEVVAAVQPSDFSEPTAADIAAIIEQVRAAGVPAVFGSEVFPSDVLEAVAADTGARYVGDLADDVLPGEPGDAVHSYVGMMVENVRAIVSNLGGDPQALESVLA